VADALGTLLHWAVIGALAAACVFWLGAIHMVVRLLRGVPVLEELAPAPPARWPSLSVIVPACDEAATLADATRSRLASDYPDLEVVLVDDRSRDATPAVVDALAAGDPRVRALHVRELPEGWLGKVHAMHRGVAAARGEWLLFTDADVHLAPDTLRRAVAHAEAAGLDHLVVLPQVRPSGLLLDAAIACFARVFTLGSRLWAVSDPESDASIGVGAFNLVRRSALVRMGGLPRVRLAVADDVLLGQLLKRSGARQAAVNGRHHVMLHWYRSVGEMLAGLEKGLYGYAGQCRPWRLFLAGPLLLLLDLAPLLALLLPLSGAVGATLPLPGADPAVAFPLWLAWLGGAAVAAGALASVVGARWIGSPLRPLLLLPAGSVLLCAMFLRAGFMGWRRGGVLWRGTFYPAVELRAALVEMAAPQAPAREPARGAAAR
jgi:hypothetical protein